MKVTIDQKTGEFSITGKIGEDGGPYESSSAKSILLASTRGTSTQEGVTWKGHNVSLNLNLSCPNPNDPNAATKKEKAAPKKASL